MVYHSPHIFFVSWCRTIATDYTGRATHFIKSGLTVYVSTYISIVQNFVLPLLWGKGKVGIFPITYWYRWSVHIMSIFCKYLWFSNRANSKDIRKISLQCREGVWDWLFDHIGSQGQVRSCPWLPNWLGSQAGGHDSLPPTSWEVLALDILGPWFTGTVRPSPSMLGVCTAVC